MTIGSPASLPGRGQEALSPTFPYARRQGRVPAMRRLQAAGAPRQHLPRVALADDPPRGRILVAADQPSVVLEVQRMLRNAGYRAVGPAGSPEEAARLTARGPIDAAIVDLGMRSAASVASKLREEGIACVWLADESAKAPAPGEIVRKPDLQASLIEVLERVLFSRHAGAGQDFYPVPPPQPVWPRIFPPL
jgi:CheY-like chemotaxis protein